MSDFVTINECARTREGMYKDLARVDVTLGIHGEENTDTKVILAKLTLLQEIALKNTNDLAIQVKEMDRRILDRESDRVEKEDEIAKDRAEVKGIIEKEKEAKFWQSPIGEKVIYAAILSFLIILLIALNQDLGIINSLLGK